jgi:uncharacterized protein YcbX
MSAENILGRVAAIWRYPVKSMAGERLAECDVTPRGLLGDRAYALIDEATGAIASAKNPRIWPDLLKHAATFVEAPSLHGPLPDVSITLHDGKVISSGANTANAELSAALGRGVRVSSDPPAKPILQQFWPILEERDEERVTDERMPARTFLDLSAVNVLVTSTLDLLSAAYAAGRFDVSRFRPNILIVPEAGAAADPEASLARCDLVFSSGARLFVDSRCGRCVMTTLAQGDLAKDIGILRTITKVNGTFAGLNTSVKQTGVIRVGDSVGFTAM